MSIISDIKKELQTAVEELNDCFHGFNFETADRLSIIDISDIQGFERFAMKGTSFLSFSQFRAKIIKGLFSIEDDFETEDFDWDNLENKFDEAIEILEHLKSVVEQVEDNLTGDQTVETATVLDKESLNETILEYLIDNNFVYEIQNEDETCYLLNAEFEKKLKA